MLLKILLLNNKSFEKKIKKYLPTSFLTINTIAVITFKGLLL